MRSTLIGLVTAVAATLVACSRATTTPTVVSLPVALPAHSATHPMVHDDRTHTADSTYGNFTSERGDVHLRDDGMGHLAGTYDAGVVTCDLHRARLDCKWTERGSEGLATFTPTMNRGWDGTWGTDASASDGGPWRLTPAMAPPPSKPDAVDSYATNWGDATVTFSAQNVHVDYSRGTMDCVRQQQGALTCNWTEGSMAGGAELTVEPNGVLRGRWGSGSSSTDGGPWVFVKR